MNLYKFKFFVLFLVIIFFSEVLGKEKVLSSEQQGESEKNSENNTDDTFFSHLNRMKIPEKFRLKEIIVGNSSAPKTLIIYFSYTCPHCREFHKNEYPKFKKLYIDKRKIKVIFRNYIDDQGAYEAAQIIRCLSKDSAEDYMKLSHLVLSKQIDWLKSENPANFLKQIFINHDEKETDIKNESEDTIKACLKRTDIGAGIMLEQQRAMRDLHIISVPIFITDNNQKHVGMITCEELAQLCEIYENNQNTKEKNTKK